MRILNLVPLGDYTRKSTEESLADCMQFVNDYISSRDSPAFRQIYSHGDLSTSVLYRLEHGTCW